MMSGAEATVAGGVAKGVEIAVRRAEFRRLARHRAADPIDLLLDSMERQIGSETGNRSELVERSARRT